MSLMERIDQRYFISPDTYYEIRDDVESWNKGLSELIFNGFTYLDENYDNKKMESLPEFYSVSEYRAFKKNIYIRIEQVKKIIELFLTRYSKIFDDMASEEDSKEYWDSIEDDDWPKNSYDSFKEWYESSGWYEWDNDNKQINIDNFGKENADLFNLLDREDYVVSHSGEWIETTAYDKKFRQIEECVESDLSDFDKRIATSYAENKYEAIIFCFES